MYKYEENAIRLGKLASNAQEWVGKYAEITIQEIIDNLADGRTNDNEAGIRINLIRDMCRRCQINITEAKSYLKQFSFDN